MPPLIETSRLEDDLRRGVRGEVRFDAQAKALYATDASNYRQIPIGVITPLDSDDVIEIVSICRRYGAPVLSRGAGTSLAGQCCNVAVVLDYSKHMNRILEINPGARTARVQPGVVLDRLRNEAEKYGLTFGPDPASHSRCTLGGMIGNNSCGVHALMAGKTVDNVHALKILTYEGLVLDVGKTSDEELAAIARAGGPRADIYRKLASIRDRYADLIRLKFPKIPRRVSGYNLDELLPENGFHVARALVGTEGTCVSVLEATLRLVPSPRAKSLLVIGYPTIYDAADAVPTLLEHKMIGLEGMDEGMVGNLKRYQGFAARIARLPEGNAWLLAEFGGDDVAQADAQAQALIDRLSQDPKPPVLKLVKDPHEVEDLWTVRESALAATAFIPGQRDRCEGWEDSAVPPARLGSYLRDLRALYDRHGYQGAFYGHFGDGCVHTRIDFDLDTAQGLKNWRLFMDEAADLVVRYGGSFSGEHGDGQARAELYPKLFGPELVGAFREFKTIWDPQGRMNPGKLVDPYGMLENLRLGKQYRPKTPATHFHYGDDQNSFARAMVRCVGVGKCRREETGLMCPSYRVTHDEKDSTRGRAHLLFEMLKGETITDGWQSEEVKDSLDLCLSCKGCKSDCPTNVDMATYKAEFLSHYYKGRLRPRSAYAFGLIYWWSRLASIFPTIVNAVTHAPVLGLLARWASGMSIRRQVPAFAQETFRHWFKNHHRPPLPPTGDEPTGRKQVLLWPDTFTNFFHPEVAIAAVKVLSDYGYDVLLPSRSLCCGRPLYDYGWLDLARKLLCQTLDTLKPFLEKDLPIVVLEPSCAAVFRDELINLLPNDPMAQRLCKQTVLLSELLLRTPALIKVERNRRAILQTHCHQKSVLTANADAEALKRSGFDVEQPESGCCGMAGSFGFEADHEAVASQIGEQALLPAVRKSSADTLLVASGFSCREQIFQSTGRKAVHLAEALALGGGSAPAVHDH